MGWIMTTVILLVAAAFAGVCFVARQILVRDISRIPPEKMNAQGTETARPSERPFAEPESLRIQSPYGYELACELYVCEDSEKAIVLCHDTGSSKEELWEYVHMFLERGMTVLTYDQRGHGETGGLPCSFGYFEPHDARECVNYLENTLGNHHQIGLWGIGMGAATAAELAKRDDRIRFVILDSGYADLSPLRPVLFRDPPIRWLQPLLWPLLSVMNWMQNGWKFSDVHPTHGMSKTAMPLLVLHGAADSIVPLAHAYRFMLERKDATLVIFPKAGHGGCRVSNPAEYRRVVQKFLIAANF